MLWKCDSLGLSFELLIQTLPLYVVMTIEIVRVDWKYCITQVGSVFLQLTLEISYI